jgi:ATPase subunit of ABC transporter with duplicated ATPase domains
MLRLRRLKINKFRAVKPGVELVFHDGFNVLLGRNATGKTTLLDLISMALRFDFSSIRDEDFDLEVEAVEMLEGTSNSVIMQVGTRLDDTEITASTLEGHVETGEERFEVCRDTRTDVVSYCVVAFSRPRVLLARLGTPIARMLQRRFGRESRQAMVQAVAGRP